MALVAFRHRDITVKLFNQQSFTVKVIREAHLKAAAVSSSNQSRKPRTKFISESFKKDEIEDHLLKKRLIEGTGGTKKHHIFNQLYPWKTRLELAEHLKKSEVYNKDGLIAICKPYGIAKSKVNEAMKKDKSTVVQTLSSGGYPAHTPCLEETLPILQDMYKTRDLEIVKCTERWTSGLVLLSSKKEMSQKVQKCFRRSKAFKRPPLSYWAVTVGSPAPETIKTKVGISLDHVDGVGKVPVIRKKYKMAEVDRGEVKLAVVKHSTLFHNLLNDAALVEVEIQTLKWHFLRVWLAHCCSPVLGDPFYSGRVRYIFDRKIQVSPHNPAAHHPLEISNKICQLLELPKDTPEIIPSLIHLAKIRLSSFNKDKTDLVLTTQPPHHFSWACEKMGIMSANELNIFEEETVQ
ncbi:mitochondrial mRNA pseudouridine synthase RPUSD3-like [Palaemon carinicauda]|uniref:mitochondrial mRNA pseudouridine synthase RPUSD3-like n=1 Tax=Palaemon carinicauda TaxID=392227 RepID=UPI0035B67C2A